MRFVKYQGLGNDFILMEDLTGALLDRGGNLAKSFCDRNFGIGADGLVLISKDSGPYTMHIFNADGSEAEMCGNAIRCVAAYLSERELVPGPLLPIRTRSGVREVQIGEGGYVVDMGEPDFSFNQGEAVIVKVKNRPWTVYPVSLGNPHGVTFVEKLSELDWTVWGPLLERAEVWPEKANIGFCQVASPEHLLVRVWERGAGATLACGTGACAAAVVAMRLGRARKKVTVTLPGGDLLIEWLNKRVFMSGPAAEVFRGEINL